MKLRHRKQVRHSKIDVKRPYVPGVTLHSQCPACGLEKTYDLERHYVDQCPTNGEPVVVYWCCDECSHEWEDGKVAYVFTVVEVP